MPPTCSSSCSSFWLSPVMPCNSASTSSCERICWFMAWRLRRSGDDRSLDDEVGEVHGLDRVVHGRAALLLAALARGGFFLGLFVLDLDAQRQHRLAQDLSRQ